MKKIQTKHLIGLENTSKEDINTFIDDRRLSGMLGIYQHLLSKRTQDFHAFRILGAIFQYIP